MNTIDKSQVHRLGSWVALWTKGQPTVYLTEQHAWDLGNALKEAAADISQRPKAADSKFTTRTIES